MARLFWIVFGMILAGGLGFGALALDLAPLPLRAGLPPKVVVTFDSEAEALRVDLAQLESERDRLAADLARVERDRDGLLDDLGKALMEQETRRAQTAAAPAVIPVAPAPQAAPAPGEILAPAAAPPEPARAATPAPGDLLWRGLSAYRRGDFRAAFDAWLPAAQAGHARAQFHLGGLYGDGDGVPRDLVRAYVWLKRAEQAGYFRAERVLVEIVPQMTAEQLVAAERQLAVGTL